MGSRLSQQKKKSLTAIFLPGMVLTRPGTKSRRNFFFFLRDQGTAGSSGLEGPSLLHLQTQLVPSDSPKSSTVQLGVCVCWGNWPVSAKSKPKLS